MLSGETEKIISYLFDFSFEKDLTDGVFLHHSGYRRNPSMFLAMDHYRNVVDIQARRSEQVRRIRQIEGVLFQAAQSGIPGNINPLEFLRQKMRDICTDLYLSSASSSIPVSIPWPVAGPLPYSHTPSLPAGPPPHSHTPSSDSHVSSMSPDPTPSTPDHVSLIPLPPGPAPPENCFPQRLFPSDGLANPSPSKHQVFTIGMINFNITQYFRLITVCLYSYIFTFS